MKCFDLGKTLLHSLSLCLLISGTLGLPTDVSGQICSPSSSICNNNNNHDWRAVCGITYDGCPANDVNLVDLRIVDPNQMGTCVSCTQGDLTTWNLVADINFGQNGNRGCFAIAGDLYINGTLCCVFSRVNNSTCISQSSGQTKAIGFGTITFRCGDQLELRNILVGWEPNCNNVCSNGMYCPSSAKCSNSQNITIKTPLGASCYEVPATCTGATGKVGVTARGGTPGYTYRWENSSGAPVGTTAEINVAPGTYNVTVTDADLCTASCSVTLTTQPDTERPTVTCPGNITVNNDAGQCGAVVNFMASANDNCGIQSISYNPMPMTFFTVGTTNVEVIATDLSGNKDTCYFNVTVNDNEIQALCKSATVYLDNNGMASITTTDIDNGTTDNCGIQSITVSPSTFNCSNVGSNDVYLTVRDVNSNVQICTTTVMVVDNTPPTALCVSSLDVYLDANGSVSITSSQIDNGSYDNCGTPTLSIAPSNFTCANVGANTVTLTAEDASGLQSTCMTTVNVIDQIPPAAICQNYTVQLNNNGNASVSVANINYGSSDNCGIAQITLSPSTFTCSNVGANTVTLTVIDVNNNMNTCTATVTVQDNVPPTALCHMATIELDNNGNASITPADIDNGSSDNCDIESMTVFPNTFDCNSVGNNEVYLTVRDVNSNEQICTTTVMVIDNTPPTALCVSSLDVYLDANGNVSITTGQIDNGSYDNCGPPTLSIAPSNFTCANVGANTVTLTAEDPSGLQSTCMTTVNVIDQIPPAAVCQNYTVQLDNNGNASVGVANINNGSSDNCGIAQMTLSPNTFTCSNVGANTVTLTVIDVNNNMNTCTATVTVQDNVPPTAICQNRTIQLDNNGNASITAAEINNGSNDNCGIQNMQVNPSTFNCTNLGPQTVVLTVSDVNGNTDNCTSTVTVQDLIAPTITCPANIVVPNDPGQCGANVVYSANYSDNCIPTVIYNPPSGSFFDINTTTTVTCTVRDQAGNSDFCTFTVTITDNVAPSITCPGNLTINCDELVDPANTGTATSTDLCGTTAATITYVDMTSSVSCANTYTITRTWTARDNAGNASSCDQTINVVDNVPPSMTCPATLNVACESDVPNPDPSSVTVTDNCSAPGQISVSHFGDSQTGTNPIYITRTYRAVDECQNEQFCTQLIVVRNLVAPTLTCPAPVTVQCPEDVPAPNIGDVIAQANCGGDVTVSHLGDVASGNCPTIITRTYRGTDESNNITDCTQRITIQDTVAPQITDCPADVDFGCSGNLEPTMANLPAAITDPAVFGATDNCTAAADLQVNFEDAGPEIDGCVYTFTRTYMIVDACGNSTTCQPQSFSFIYDVTPPVFSDLPEDQVYACGAPVPDVAHAPTITDDCLGAVTVTFSETKTTGGCLGESYVRTWTATDACGNVSSYSQVASKQDLTPPEIIHPNDTIIECGQPIPPLEYEIIEDCDESRYELEYQEKVIPGSCACEYTIMRIWYVYNNCLSEIRDTQYIRVIDETGPTITMVNPMLVGMEHDGIMKMYDCTEPGVTMGDILVDDCCGVADVITYDSLLAYKSSEAFEYFALWKCGYIAIDPCGNKTEFHFYVQQIDTTAPSFAIPDTFEARIDLSCGETLPEVDSILIQDDCDLIPVLSYQADTVGFYPDSFAVIRSWEASDACLNTAVIQQTITVCNFEPDSFVGEVGNLVWLDDNQNGIQDINESGINGMIIELYADKDFDLAPDDQPFRTTLSKTRNGIDGQYFFSNLEPGYYFVKAVPSADQHLVAMHMGDDEQMDSDIDPSSGFSPLFEVTRGQKNFNIDIGIIPMDAADIDDDEDQTDTNNNNNTGTGGSISSFSINEEGCSNVLHWSITSDQKENNFDILRSSDGQHFEQIGTVQSSSAHTSFSFEDKNVSGVLYYRLLYSLVDGITETSSDIRIENNCHSVMNYILFPNPATNHFTIKYQDVSPGDLNGELIDIYGRVVKSWSIGKKFKGDKDQIELSVPQGLYMVRIWNDNGQSTKSIMIME